jgi:prepilin-type processing-associated H-X9-DG protein
MYADDNQERFPAALTNPYGPDPAERWPGLLIEQGYLGGKREFFMDPAFDLYAHDPFLTRSFLQASTDQGARFDWQWFSVEYGANWYHVWGSAAPELNGETTLGSELTARVSEIDRPSETISLTDSMSFNTANPNVRWGYLLVYDRYFGPGSGAQRPDGRHNKSVQTLWVDGHVSLVKIEDQENPWGTGMTDAVQDANNWWDRY